MHAYIITSAPGATFPAISSEAWWTLTEKTCCIPSIDAGCSSNAISNSRAFVYGWRERKRWRERECKRGRERERERHVFFIPHCFMHVGYLHRLQDRLVDRDYSSTVFHRPYYRMPSNFQHCPLAPHSMQILAVCDTFAWLVGCDISKEMCPAHPSNFSWSPNIHILYS